MHTVMPTHTGSQWLASLQYGASVAVRVFLLLTSWVCQKPVKTLCHFSTSLGSQYSPLVKLT